MEKADRQTLKALKEKPISKAEYEKLKQDREATKKWIEDLRKNYPGVMHYEEDGVSVYWW